MNPFINFSDPLVLELSTLLALFYSNSLHYSSQLKTKYKYCCMLRAKPLQYPDERPPDSQIAERLRGAVHPDSSAPNDRLERRPPDQPRRPHCARGHRGDHRLEQRRSRLRHHRAADSRQRLTFVPPHSDNVSSPAHTPVRTSSQRASDLAPCQLIRSFELGYPQ